MTAEQREILEGMAGSYAYEAGVLQAALENVRDRLTFTRLGTKRARNVVIEHIDETLALVERAAELRRKNRG